MLSPARRYACALAIGLTIPAGADLEARLADGDFVAAEKTLEELASEWETAAETPSDRIEWARTLHALGTIERRILDAEDAESHLTLALSLFEKHAPGEAAETREALALTKQDRGALDEAEALFRKNHELGHPRTPSHLGLLLLQKGSYEESGRMLTKALDDCPEDQTIELTRRHADLGRYWHTLGSHARALGHFESGLTLLEVKPNELTISLTSQKALAELRLGDEEQAAKSFEHAADLAREAFVNRPLEAIPYINNLGILALSSDDPESAARHFEEALSILTEAQLADHPAAITPLNNLGVARLRLDSFNQAYATLVQARELQREHLSEAHLRVAETERNIAAASMMLERPDARKWIGTANQSGLDLLERLVRHGSETERLNFLQRIDLVSLSCTLGEPETIANLLLASKARLLDQLIQPIDPQPAPTWATVRDKLPKDAALLDFVRYTPPRGESRYGAILITKHATPRWIPLATESRIQNWLSALQGRLEWKAAALAGEAVQPPPFTLEGILRELHACVIEPIDPHLPDDCKQLIFSPDGIIHAVPFAVLRSRDGTYLCQDFELGVQVDSGRDLLAPPPTRTLDDHPWLLAGVSRFPTSDSSDSDPLSEVLRNPTALPGTRRELRRIDRLAPPASEQQLELTEEALRELSFSPRILHLSTHSFFLDHDAPSSEAFDFDRSAHRFYASGILLHRAAQREPGTSMASPNDDLLFPGEITTLPLKQTRLVTLSSCESGVGTPVQGEGVLGLRRAFALAGSREVVTALWPVSDQGSPRFMERFYQLCLSTENPAQALWQSQREFLANATDPEEALLFNGPFILAQRGPLLPLGEVVEPRRSFPWLWLLVLAPLALFVLARLAGKIQR
ncbi:MAG: CHAT domain-containing protein [Verrucomicrobiota bacterium]